jgi:hypothetical protein
MVAPLFIKNLIIRRFENSENMPSTAYWNKFLSNLSDDEHYQLVTFCIEAIGLKPKKNKIAEIVQTIKDGNDFLISDELLDINQKFNTNIIHIILDCIVISEYRIDSNLLLPPELRIKNLDKLSESVGVETKFLIQIDNFWRQKRRVSRELSQKPKSCCLSKRVLFRGAILCRIKPHKAHWAPVSCLP